MASTTSSASDQTARSGLPGPYDLIWLSDSECPVVEDIGLGLACVKSRGHRQISVAFCPAAIVLPREKDTIRRWWQPHGYSPIEPRQTPSPDLELESRRWYPNEIDTTYLLAGTAYTQSLSVFPHGARAEIRPAPHAVDQATLGAARPGGTRRALVLRGESRGAAAVRVEEDTIYVAEESAALRPYEYVIAFDPPPESIEIIGPEARRRIGSTVHADEAIRWRVAWGGSPGPSPPGRRFLVEWRLLRAAWIPAAQAQSLPESDGDRASAAPAAPAAPAASAAPAGTDSWARYFDKEVPRFHTPDERINRLMDHLAYGYRANELTIGGLFPHRFVMPKETFWNFWMWDSCFHAVAGRWFGNRPSIWGNLLNAANAQYPAADSAAGCINNSAHPYGLIGFISDDPMSKRRAWMPHEIPQEHGDGSHLPVYAQALAAVWETTGNNDNLERLLPAAMAYHDWFERTRASESIPGLLLVRRWSDSGMDNSKRWGRQGSGIYGTQLDTMDWSMPIVTIDLNAFSILEKRALAQLWSHLGDQATAHRLQGEADAREVLLHERLWDETAGFYFDIAEDGARRIPVWSPIGFIPILLPQLPEERVSRLLDRLFDEKKFWLKAPLPTVAADDPDFRPDHSYWMGPTWMSYMIPILRGLFRRAPEAGWTLLDRMLDYLVVGGNPRVFENYNPVTGVGQDCPDFGWHGMLIDVVLTELLGIGLDPGDNYRPRPGRCRAPRGWSEWRVENLYVRGRRYNAHGRHQGDVTKHDGRLPGAATTNHDGAATPGAPGDQPDVWQVDIDE